MSTPSLTDRTKQELALLAKRRGIRGWDTMKKDELVRALSAPAKPAKPAAKPTKPAAKVAVKTAPVKPAAKPGTNGTTKHVNGAAKLTAPAKPPAPKPALPAAKPPAPPSRLPAAPVKPVAKVEPKPVKPTPAPASRPEPSIPADKDLSARTAKAGVVKDRILLTAPDPFWLHAFWELSVQSVQRAEAALGQDWYGARPVIRLFDVTSQDTTSTSESPVRDIFIHGGCNHWYVDVAQPPKSYRADIGYLTRSGRFFPLSRSNVVVPPKAGASEALDEGLPTEARPTPEGPPAGREVMDDHFRRPLKDNPFGSGAVLPGKLKKFFFDIDAELVVYVKTDPAATVTLQNEQVKLRADGTAVMRFSLPDSRQIIPAVATSADGMEEQTIVLAVERNTKRLDPMIHDLYGEN